jgi:hypothetical protein
LSFNPFIASPLSGCFRLDKKQADRQSIAIENKEVNGWMAG